jgi:hypothetical protein
MLHIANTHTLQGVQLLFWDTQARHMPRGCCLERLGASTVSQDSFGMFLSCTGANLCIQK